MGKIITTKIFVEMAKKVHGSTYDYSKAIYTKSHNKVDIICPVHGLFSQRANGHLNGFGCLKCAIERVHLQQRLTTEEFINRSNKIHNFKYRYHNSVYKNWGSKIIISCPQHGDFKQFAGDHLHGAGCRLCARAQIKNAGKMQISEFISRANKIHKNRYDYSKVKYINNRTNIIIKCPIHGEFLQIPDNHLRGFGCKKCFYDKKRVFYEKQFIKNATRIHNNLYDYSDSFYIRSNKKVKIICSIHGAFYQYPDNHLHGAGCPNCRFKEEFRLGEMIKKEFKAWKVQKYKKFYSKEHRRYRKFDYFLKKGNNRLIIEYDGLQHFKPIRFSKKMTILEAERKFFNQKITDEKDTFFCNRKKIILFRISYKDNMEEKIKEIKESF